MYTLYIQANNRISQSAQFFIHQITISFYTELFIQITLRSEAKQRWKKSQELEHGILNLLKSLGELKNKERWSICATSQ